VQRRDGCECVPHNVCHHAKSDGFFTPIRVSERAIPRHLAHEGDCLIVNDTIPCTVARCDPVLGCVQVPDDSRCDNGVFCDGRESCDPVSGCVAVSACPPSIDGCIIRNDSCDEDNDVCVDRADDTLCDDGFFCTTDSCDPNTGLCGYIDTCPATIDLVNCLEYGRCDEANQDCPADPLPDCCGNGIVEAGEECDDGGTTPGDGCDAACQLECAALQVVCTSDGECCDAGAGAVCGADFCGGGSSCCFPTGVACPSGDHCDCCDDDLCSSGVCTNPPPNGGGISSQKVYGKSEEFSVHAEKLGSLRRAIHEPEPRPGPSTKDRQ
jgi:cysteine-rich repeat protein